MSTFLLQALGYTCKKASVSAWDQEWTVAEQHKV